MNDIIEVGFESENLSFKKEMTVSELITVITENVSSFKEAMKASEMLEGIWTSGSYEGTGWRFWFSRKDEIEVSTIH